MAGSWVGDSIEEFKKAPPAGKVAIVLAFVAVVGIGYYEYSKSKSSSSGVSGSSSPSTDLSGAGASQYPIVPGSGQGSVPVLPGGLQAIFDPLGNLIGWQPAPTPSPTPSPTPKPTPTPTPKPPPGKQPPPKPGKKPTEPEKGTDLGSHRDVGNRDIGSASHQRQIQPPTGTMRGSRPGPGQGSRPLPHQPVPRRVPPPQQGTGGMY